MALDAPTYDRIEEAEKAILNSNKGIEDSINELNFLSPESFNESFLQLLEEISNVKNTLESYKLKFNEILSMTTDTNVIVKDILEGSTYSPWISELREKGKSSSVYSDSSKMSSLIEYYKAVNDYTIAPYLMQWAIDNNKFSTIAKTASNDADFNWSSITNPVQLFSNEEAFTLFAKNAACVKVIFPENISDSVRYNGTWLFDYITSYKVTVEPGLRASESALNVLVDCDQSWSPSNYNFTVSANSSKSITLSYSKGAFINYITFSSKPASVTITDMTTKPTIVGGQDFDLASGKVNISRFTNGNSVVTVKAGSSPVSVSFNIMDMYIV